MLLNSRHRSRSPVLLAYLSLAVACSEEGGDASSPSGTGTETVASTTGASITTGSSSTTGSPSSTVGTSSTGTTSSTASGVQGTGGSSSTSGNTTATDSASSSGGNTTTTDGATNSTGGGTPSDCIPEGRAHNPLVTQIFTADPNAIVYEDKVYVYTSHDEDGQDGFDMIDYHVYSSDDMVNWQDHGVIIHSDDLPWSNNRLFAPGACSKNGEYYLYMPNSGSAIGVAVADDPGGPFVDPLGVALITPSFPNANVPWLFDPACFIDDDGQAYLYFGGGDNGEQNARVVRLNDDMISIKDTMATTVPTTAFFEASYMHKRDGKYYFSYSSDFSSGHGAALEYLMSDSPMSGFEYVGKFLESATINRGNNNHGSIIDFAGKTYLFYHNRKLEQELGVDKINNRSIAVQELSYAADGKITPLTMSTDDYTVSQVKCLDGFTEVEAERLAQEHGIEVEGLAGETVRVAQIEDGDWIAYSQVDFRDGATSLVAQVASASGGGTIDVLIDGCIGGEVGTSIGTCEVVSTGGADTFASLTCALTQTSGPHDLCLSFSGNPSFEIDSFHLE